MPTITIYCNGTGSSIADAQQTPNKYPEGELISRLAISTTSETMQLDGPGAGASGYLGKIFGYGWQANKDRAVARVRAIAHLEQGQINVNLVGWSRGGITCFMIANALAGINDIAGRLDVRIIALDPVAGASQNVGTTGRELPAIVTEYMGFYAEDELSNGFAATVPNPQNQGTRMLLISVPGRHATMVGNMSQNGNNGPADPRCRTVATHVRRAVVRKLRAFGATFNEQRLQIQGMQAARLLVPVQPIDLRGMRNHTYHGGCGGDYRNLWLGTTSISWASRNQTLENALEHPMDDSTTTNILHTIVPPVDALIEAADHIGFAALAFLIAALKGVCSYHPNIARVQLQERAANVIVLDFNALRYLDRVIARQAWGPQAWGPQAFWELAANGHLPQPM